MAAQDEVTEPQMSRREFLNLALTGVAALGALGGIGAVLAYLSPPQDQMLGSGEPVAVADESAIPLDTGRCSPMAPIRWWWCIPPMGLWPLGRCVPTPAAWWGGMRAPSASIALATTGTST